MATLRKRIVNNSATFGLAHFDNTDAGDIQAVALVDSSGNEIGGAGAQISAQSYSGVLGAGITWNTGSSATSPFTDGTSYQAISVAIQSSTGGWPDYIGVKIEQSATGVFGAGAGEIVGFTWERFIGSTTQADNGLWSEGSVQNEAIHTTIPIYLPFFRVSLDNQSVSPVTMKLTTTAWKTSPGTYPLRVENPRLEQMFYPGTAQTETAQVSICGIDPSAPGVPDRASVFKNRAVVSSQDYGIVVRVAQEASEKVFVTESAKTLTTANVTSSTPGTPVLVSALAGQMDITALSNNVGTVYIGASNVNAAAKRGRPLNAGGFYSMAAASASSIYIDVTNSGDGISYNRFA